MQFTKPVLSKFRGDFKEAVKELEKKYDAEISIGNIRFTADEFSSKLNVTAKSATTEDAIMEKARKEFNMYCSLYDLKQEDFGRQIIFGNKKYTIVGINTRATKSPIIVKCNDGKRYKMSVNFINLASKLLLDKKQVV